MKRVFVWGWVVLGLGGIVGGCGDSGDGAAGPDEPPTPSEPPAFAAFPDTTDGVITTSTGLQYTLLQQGEGDFPRDGDVVTVHYTGTFEDGTVFDSSLDREPLSFQLGRGFVISGWDEGIALMRQGDRVRLVIPPGLAYGAAGRGPIPPNATLIFEVELLEIASR